MAIEVDDVLRVSLVLAGTRLLEQQHQRERFIRQVGVDVQFDVLPDPMLPLPVQMPGTRPSNADYEMRLLKERVSVRVTQGNTIFEQEYPTEDDLSRLAEVAQMGIQSSNALGTTIAAYGCNFEMVFSQDSPKNSSEYLAHKLLSPKWQQYGVFPLAGGHGQVVFQSDKITLTFRVEPRVSDPTNHRIFIRLNQHSDQQLMPNGEVICKALELGWSNTIYFAKTLDY